MRAPSIIEIQIPAKPSASFGDAGVGVQIGALVQIFNLVDAALCFDCSSCGERGIPQCGRGFGMNWQFAEFELVFANTVEEFDTGDCDSCPLKSLEAEHGTDPGFHASMILLNHVVEIFGRPQLGVFPNLVLVRQFADGSMRGGIAIKGYDTRRTPLWVLLQTFRGRCDRA